MDAKRPIIGITMGDPAGIGPEIAAQAMAERHVYDICRPLVAGDAETMRQASKITDVGMGVREISRVEDVQLLENYYQKMLGQLLEHDRINPSGLVSTLETFLNESGNLSSSAEKLYIHRNTLIYRINKIEEITSVNLREIKEMMKFELAFMIGRYLKNCFS